MPEFYEPVTAWLTDPAKAAPKKSNGTPVAPAPAPADKTPASTPPANDPTPTNTGATAMAGMLGNLQSLQDYGFSQAQIQSLVSWYQQPSVQLESTDQQALDLWNSATPAGKIMEQQFPGIFQQMKNGQEPMSPTDYVQYKQDIQSFAAGVGLPQGFITDADIGQMVGSGMTLNDLSTRISDAQQALTTSNSDTLATLKSYYGISPTNGALVAYALNPDHPLFANGASLADIFQSAEVGGAGKAEGYNISQGTAMQAVTEGGMTGATASTALNKEAPNLALTRGYGVIGQGVGSITQQQLQDVALGIGGEAPQEALLQAAQKRASSTSGGGGYAQTSRGSAVGSARETGSSNEGA
jgi:hypothetical protein